MRTPARWVAMLLLCVMLLSGCGSIILNGNLSFEANPPISPLPSAASLWIGSSSAERRAQAAANVRFAYGDVEKYDIGGTRAFAILPGHVSPADVPSLNQAVSEANANLDPADAIELYRGDFEVIDYNEATESFVYAYYVPYVGEEEHRDENYPEVRDTGLTAARSGSAAGFTTARPEKIADISGMVFVLMSYTPRSGSYQVFFSKKFTMEENQTDDIRMLAGKVAGQPIYYAYADDYLYLFDRNGEKQFSSSYSSIVASKATSMVSQQIFHNSDVNHFGGVRYDGNTAYSLRGFWRWTVADVEVDQNFMPYITLNIEYSTKDFAAADREADDIVNNDEDIEDTEDGSADGSTAEKVGDVIYFHGTFACLRIGVDESGMKFLSDISEDALAKLLSEELTITQESHTYEEMREEVTETARVGSVSENSAAGSTGSENNSEESADSEDSTEIDTRWETYEETLARLQDAGAPEGAEEHDLVAEYYEKDGVLDALNEFSIYDTEKEPGVSGIYFALGGGSTGYAVNYYDASGSRVGSADYHSFKDEGDIVSSSVMSFWWWERTKSTYSSRDFAWYAQPGLAQVIASTANTNHVYVPFLTPGAYGGRDWAYYNIYGYYETNGDYSTNGVDYFKGHAQPLVSPEIYRENVLMGSYDKIKEATLQSDAEGSFHWYDRNGDELDDMNLYYDQMYASASNGLHQYYYNGSVMSNFWMSNSDYDISWPSAQHTDNSGRLAYYLPYVLVYHKTTYSDGTSEEEYATIQHDSVDCYVLPTQVLEQSQDITLRYQYVLTDGIRSDVYFEMSKSLTIPTEYRMMFPEGSYITISGDTWIGNMVKAENEVGALTYYTSTGKTLMRDNVYFWVNRYLYPIYDNATDTVISLESSVYLWGFSWWFWLFFEDSNYYDFYLGDKSRQKFSTVQIQKQGFRSRIYDRLVPGEAQDLGVWTIDGDTTIALFTDQVIRFYQEVPGQADVLNTREQDGSQYIQWEDEGSHYETYAQINLNELQLLSEGYFLREKSDGWVASYTDTGSEATAQLAEAAMNSDDADITLSSDNILPLGGGERFLYFSTAGSLYLLSLLNGGENAERWQKHGRLMPLMDGTYYRVFSVSGGNKLVGFQTANYSYTPSDACMARVYDIDINELVQRRADESVGRYLDSLRNLYLNENHTLLRKVENVGTAEQPVYISSYSIVAPDTTNPEYARALSLFAGARTEALSELDAICAEYSVTRSAGMEEKLDALRELLLTQRQALTEMYDLLGINFTGLPDQWQYIQYEGLLYNAAYESIIESMMVEIVLSEEYLLPFITPQRNGYDGLIGVHRYDEETDGPEDEVYFITDTRGAIVTEADGTRYVDELAEQRAAYMMWQASARGSIAAGAEIGEGDMTEQLMDLYTTREAIADITEITGMEFYQVVLEKIKDKYLSERRDEG